jgi:hypothetical protein
LVYYSFVGVQHNLTGNYVLYVTMCRPSIAEGCRKLHKEKFHGVSLSPNVTSMIQSRRMRWTGHIARVGEQRNEQRMLVERREGPEEQHLLLLQESNRDSLVTVPIAMSQPHILRI